MKFGTSMVIFFLAIIALVAEVVLYFVVGLGAAFSGNVEAMSGLAFFFVSLMVLTAAAGLLAPVSSLVELAVKKKNVGIYVMASGMALVLVGLVVARAVGGHAVAKAKREATVAGRASAAAPARAAAPADKWRVNQGKSPMDGSPTVTLALDSENPIDFWLGSATPTLVIRCREHRTDVYVVTGTASSVEYGTDAHSVRVRLDDAKAFRGHWDQSTDDKALFAPSAVGLARRLARSKRMLFQFTPFDSNPAMAKFDLTGLDKHIELVAQACGWRTAAHARRPAERTIWLGRGGMLGDSRAVLSWRRALESHTCLHVVQAQDGADFRIVFADDTHYTLADSGGNPIRDGLTGPAGAMDDAQYRALNNLVGCTRR